MNNVLEGLNMQEALQTAKELGVKEAAMAINIAPTAQNVQPTGAPAAPELPDENMTTGLVVDNSELIKDMQPKTVAPAGALTDDTMANISEYLNEYDERVEEAKEAFAEKHGTRELEKREAALAGKESEDEEEEEENEDPQEQFLEEYEKAVVIIDKTGMGVVNFTDAEREKLERVKKIKVEEVESLDLETIKVKKPKKKNLGKILEKTKNTLKTTNIVLPASGYTATVKGCSAYELLELVRDTKNLVQDNETKWSLIYSKIENTSIGKFRDFTDFLEKTSTLDYNVFIYGILCATYPDDDMIPLTCQKCKKEFEHHYSIKSLIRAEEMDDELKDLVSKTIDSSYLLPEALQCHSEAPVNEVKRYKLPNSEIIVDLYIQSVYDFIYTSIKKLGDKKDSKFAQASILSTAVQRFLIPDEDGEYFEIDEPEDIVEVIYNLNDIDIKILNLKTQDLIAGKQFEFGLMDMTCPHCGNYVKTLPMNVEQILFFRYQKALNTEVE